MARAANEDWYIGQVVVVPHAWRGDGLWSDIQSEAQTLIGTALRELYAELLEEPLSPGWTKLVRKIDSRWEAHVHHG